jgi:hypothetical protein
MTRTHTSLFVAAVLLSGCTATDRLLYSRDAAADFAGNAGGGGAGAGGGGGAGSGGSTAGAGGIAGGTVDVDAGAGAGGSGGQADAGPVWTPVSVTLTRTGALGFCIYPGQMFRVEAVPDQAGGVVVSGEIHRGYETTPTCGSAQCPIRHPFGPVTLSAEQQARLGALVAAVPAGQCAGPPGGGCDPCQITTVTIDGVGYVDNPCSAELCPGYFKAMYAIESFFDGLVPECARVLPLKCGDRVTHSTTVEGRANVWGGYNVTARAESGRETVYAFDAPDQCTVVATLKDLTADLDLLWLIGCDPSRNLKASSTPIDLQTVETITWSNVPGRTDYVVVDGYAGAEGSYTLEVDCTCQ